MVSCEFSVGFQLQQLSNYHWVMWRSDCDQQRAHLMDHTFIALWWPTYLPTYLCLSISIHLSGRVANLLSTLVSPTCARCRLGRIQHRAATTVSSTRSNRVSSFAIPSRNIIRFSCTFFIPVPGIFWNPQKLLFSVAEIAHVSVVPISWFGVMWRSCAPNILRTSSHVRGIIISTPAHLLAQRQKRRHQFKA